MKSLYFFGISFIFLFCYFGNNCEHIRTSSSGPFYLQWRETGHCEDGMLGSNELQFNVRLSKKNRKTEIFGNYTFLIPLDDRITLNINFMRRGSSGAWQPNAFFLKFSRGCSDIISFVGNPYKNYLRSMNMPKCPIPQGTYIQNGFDVQLFMKNHSSPPTFWYGSYKIIASYNRQNEIVGCIYTVVDVKPTWEKNF